MSAPTIQGRRLSDGVVVWDDPPPPVETVAEQIERIEMTLAFWREYNETLERSS